MINKKYLLIFLIIINTIGINMGWADKYSKFIAELPTPGEYTLFANNGWDGNWYIGYEHGWISALPAIDLTGYEKIYVGARLGRAKTIQQIEKKIKGVVGEIKGAPHEFYMGISDSADSKPPAKVLTKNIYIPLEGAATEALYGVSESKWFWIEINKTEVNTETSNFIHIWTNNSDLQSVEVSPVLAAGVGSNENNNSFLVKGGSKKVIKYFEPALAVKLVKSNAPKPAIVMKSFKSHELDEMKQIIKTEVSGEYISEVGIQLDKGEGWTDHGYSITQPPYDMVFSFKDLSPGKYKIRCRVLNWWGNKSYSEHKAFTIEAE